MHFPTKVAFAKLLVCFENILFRIETVRKLISVLKLVVVVVVGVAVVAVRRRVQVAEEVAALQRPA
jgi:hypothetical protein